MSPALTFDHRRSAEPTLVQALHAREPLALAESYHRTAGAAHACARRLLGAADEVEALLYRVYRELWERPPVGEPLEGWVRAAAHRFGAGYLRARGRPPAAPSLAVLLPELRTLPPPSCDSAERVLAGLLPRVRHALVRAHDAAIPSWEQDDAEAALDAALLALAGEGPADAGEPVPLLADWALGLLAPDEAAAVEATVAREPRQAARARLLRRGRLRIEGLPPHPDMGQRVLVTILARVGERERA